MSRIRVGRFSSIRLFLLASRLYVREKPAKIVMMLRTAKSSHDKEPEKLEKTSFTGLFGNVVKKPNMNKHIPKAVNIVAIKLSKLNFFIFYLRDRENGQFEL